MDIDSDLANSIRAKVIDYVRHKYGENAVCGIMTTTQQAPKGSVNIAAKFYGFKMGENYLDIARTITKNISKDVGLKFDSLVDESGNLVKEGSETTLFEYLNRLFTKPVEKEILRWAKIIEGSVTAYGAHAAGIVISDNDDVSDYIPLRANTKLGIMTTQCDMVQVEDNGLLKMDFLGLTTLDIITDTLRMIERNYGRIINIMEIDTGDSAVYEKIFTKGQTNAVFQFESNGMKQMLMRFKPKNFEDLVILVSMFRPGPLQFIDDVIDVKNGTKPMTFLCPELEPILGKTYGAIVYQEQVMEIFQKLAGYTFGGADTVRRYMSKKKADKLEHERESFINGDPERGIIGCVKNGISAEVAAQLFKQMSAFAEYAFNKSHAACYAFNAYLTAWLKLYYPAEFIASALNWAELDDYSGLLYEASAMKVKVFAPDVNKSGKNFEAVDGNIYYGLASVRGVKTHADDIIQERRNGEYKSLLNFYIRVNPNATVVSNLIDAGACDEFCENRAAMHTYIEEVAPICTKIRNKTSFIKSAEFVLPEIEMTTSDQLIKKQQDAGLKVEIDTPTESSKLIKRIETAKTTLSALKSELKGIMFKRFTEDKSERLKKEYDLLGAYISEHPMDHYPEKTGVGAVVNAAEDTGILYGLVTDLEIKKRKSDGAQFAFFRIEDKSGSIKAAMFTKVFVTYGSALKNGAVALFTGECRMDGDDDDAKLQFVVKTMELVEPKRQELMMSVPDYAEFALTHEKTFREMYESSCGYPLYIFDGKTGKTHEAGFMVSEKALALSSVKEV